MRTIDLTTELINIRSGEAITQPVVDDDGKPVIINEKKTCEECGSKLGGEVEKRPSTVRDYFLTLLGSKFPVVETKEHFWTTKIGIKMSDKDNDEIQLSEDKIKFLKRIVKNNETKQVVRTPMGNQEKEAELFYPYEVGQLLTALDVTRDSELEDEKEAKELKEEMDKKSK